MAEHAQIDVRNGKTLVRIHSGWGIPKLVLPTLRKVKAMGRRTPQDVALEFIQQFPDTGFGLNIIAKDFQPDALSFRYTVDVSTLPWKVVQEKCAGYPIIDNGNGTASISPNIAPAHKRTLFIGRAKSEEKKLYNVIFAAGPMESGKTNDTTLGYFTHAVDARAAVQNALHDLDSDEDHRPENDARRNILRAASRTGADEKSLFAGVYDLDLGANRVEYGPVADMNSDIETVSK